MYFEAWKFEEEKNKSQQTACLVYLVNGIVSLVCTVYFVFVLVCVVFGMLGVIAATMPLLCLLGGGHSRGFHSYKVVLLECSSSILPIGYTCM